MLICITKEKVLLKRTSLPLNFPLKIQRETFRWLLSFSIAFSRRKNSHKQVFPISFYWADLKKTTLFVETFPSNSFLTVGQWEALPVSSKGNSMCSSDEPTAVKHSEYIQLLPVLWLPKSLNKGCTSYGGFFVHFVQGCEAWWGNTGDFFVVMLVLCLTDCPDLSDGGLQATLLLPESLRSLRSEWSNWSRYSGFRSTRLRSNTETWHTLPFKWNSRWKNCSEQGGKDFIDSTSSHKFKYRSLVCSFC